MSATTSSRGGSSMEGGPTSTTRKTLNLFGTLSGRGKRVAVAAASIFSTDSTSNSSTSPRSSSATSSASSSTASIDSSSSYTSNVKVTPLRLPSVRELKQLYEKDVIQGRSSSTESQRGGRSGSLVDFPDLGTSDSEDDEDQPCAEGGEATGSLGRKRGSKIVQQKAMLFGGVKWKPNPTSTTSSPPTPNLSSSPPMTVDPNSQQRRKPTLASFTKAKDEIVRPQAASAPFPSTSSPRSNKKKDKKEKKEKDKKKNKKEKADDRSSSGGGNEDEANEDGVGSSGSPNNGIKPLTLSDKKRTRRALTDMGRPALPLFLRSSDDKAATKKSSHAGDSSSTESLSLEAISDEWGTYSSHSSPSNSTRKSPRSPSVHSDSDLTPKSGLSLNMAALQATIQVQKSSERKGDRSKEKNGPRPQSPRSRNREFLIKTFQEEANSSASSQLARKNSTMEEDDMVNLESFAFWLLADNFKRSANVCTSPEAHRVRRDFAAALYAKYLRPSQCAVSPAAASARPKSPRPSDAPVVVSPSILSDIESQFAKKDAPLHPLLFEGAQAEVWRVITKDISYSFFLKKLFHSVLTCDMEVEAWKNTPPQPTPKDEEAAKEGRAVQNLKQSMFLIPDVVFAEFIRYSSASSGVTVAPPELNGLVQGMWERGKWEEESEEDGVRISQMTFNNGSLPACRGIGVVPAPSHKVLDFMMSLDERSMWDDLYGVGRVEKNVRNVGQLLRIELWIPGGRNVQARDLLVFRTAKRFSDGTCVYLYRSVHNRELPSRENCIRAGTKLSGFLIVPAPDNTSTIIAISQLDPKGYIPPTAIKALNRMQVKLISRLGRHIQDVARASEQLAGRHGALSSPFVVSALYSYNCAWNQEKLFAKHNKDDFEEAEGESGKDAEPPLQQALDGNNAGNRTGSQAPWVHRAQKYLSFREGDRIVVLGKKKPKAGNPSRLLLGYNERTRSQGLFDVDYVRCVPASGGGNTSGSSIAVASAAAIAVASTTADATEAVVPAVGEDENHLSPGYLALADLLGLSECGLRIVEALCGCIESAAEVERTARAYMEILRAFPNRSLPLLFSLIADEVRATGKVLESTLFRGNDIASHLLSVYCQIVGKTYLVDTLHHLVELVVDTYAKGKSLEVDPIRIQPEQILEKNIENLEQLCSIFLGTITNSIAQCPMPLRVICHHLHKEVVQKFPESKYSVLSGFFFLRFICPAIVSPERYGLIDAEDKEISAECRRGLVLVSKVIQNLANGVEFGEKEQHMTKINRFIASNMVCAEAFFEVLSTPPTMSEALEKVPLEEMVPQVRALHFVLCSHLPAIGSKLASMPPAKNLGAAPFKQLTEILVRCPVPQPMPEITGPVPLPKKHKLRKIIQKVQIKKEKADRERKEKKDKERKEREHQREVRKEQRAADQLEKERSERQRQKEILHQEIRRVGGNVNQIEKREPPPVPSRASKPARRTVGSALALGSQRRGDSFDGTASDEISTKSTSEPPSLGELYTKKDSIQRGIESLFVAATSQSSEFGAIRVVGASGSSGPRRSAAHSEELAKLLRSFESIVRRIDRLESATAAELAADSTSPSSTLDSPTAAGLFSASMSLLSSSPSSSSGSPLSSLQSSADALGVRPPEKPLPPSSSLSNISSGAVPTVSKEAPGVLEASEEGDNAASIGEASPPVPQMWMRASGNVDRPRTWHMTQPPPSPSPSSPASSPSPSPSPLAVSQLAFA